jgi:outer membrane immunogenic protein
MIQRESQHRGKGGIVMKRLVIVGFAAGLLTIGPAVAADMGAPPMLMKAPAPSVYNWTGIYIGGHAGCGWADAPVLTAFNTEDVDHFDHHTENASGCFSGGQIGADYQFAGGFVIGVLGELSWGKISSFNQSIGDLGLSVTSWESKLTSMGTARGRIGYAIGGGLPIVGGLGWMPYFTAGWAWGNNKVSTQVSTLLNPFTSDTASLSGWTVGGGLEYAITPTLSWKAEYLYTRYNAASYAGTIDDDIGVTPGLTLDRMNLSTFKTGLNLRLGGGRF